MRELTLPETRLPAGGRSQEFRTLARHEIPRWEERPNHWTVTPESPGKIELESPPETGARQSPAPAPLRWLPRRDEWPEVF